MLVEKRGGNNFKIEGILSDINLEYGSFEKNGVTNKVIRGSYTLRVEQKICGENQTLEVPIYVFATEKKKSGDTNEAYANLEKMMNSYVSIAAGGVEKADYIRVTGANIKMNEFFSQDGQFVSYPRINSAFFRKVSKDDFKPEATFTITAVIDNITDKLDSEGVEYDPRQVKVDVILPQYGGTVDKISLEAKTPGVISGIESTWSRGDTVNIAGVVNFSSKTEITTVDQAFGDPVTKSRTINVNELIITGGSEPLDGEFAYDIADIKEALIEREKKIEAMKNKEKPAPKKALSDIDF